jgi:hypothetical protein
MEVSRSGYYQYIKTGHTMKIDQDFGLLSEVRQIHGDTRGSYGSRRTSLRKSKTMKKQSFAMLCNINLLPRKILARAFGD